VNQEYPGIADEADDQARLVPGTEAELRSMFAAYLSRWEDEVAKAQFQLCYHRTVCNSYHQGHGAKLGQVCAS
jgi:hypothetical protein